jgi:iron complex outermembrane recepter protein
MKKQLFNGAAIVALVIPGVAFAQSTGSIDAETIVVTGSRAQGIQGVVQPQTPKAQTVLTNDYIQTQTAGSSIINAINVVPSVNFTDNDAYGSSGGNVRIRGFDGNRIALTWDGVPLNDTGNYAIFSNQQLDPEIIDQVNVNQGTTDVDSPTAAAAGGTINYRTIVPSHDIGAILGGTIGEDARMRVFGMLQSGDITSSGLRMFAAASYARNDKYKGPGRIEKQQYNLRFYQPLSGTDFISIAGHFNRNRNAFYRNLTLDQAKADYQDNGEFNLDNDAVCVQPTPVRGTAQNYGATSCTNFYGVRINPSDTGNIRINSKFTLSDKLVLTVDPSFQYVLANGGGYTLQAENSALAKGSNQASAGADFNHDGDTLDTVGFYTPNTTNTYRYGVLASLRYDFTEGQYVRLAYALDYGRHRQTGEWTYLDGAGNPLSPFGGVNNPGIKVYNNDGYALRQRDRFSIAELNQVSGEYVGQFFDDKLKVQVGARFPFFHRELNNYCLTSVSNGFATCTTQVPLTSAPATGSAPYIVAPGTTFTGTVPTNAFYAPFRATYNYHPFLPNLGFTFNPADNISMFGSYAKGFSSPRTDNLYRAPFVGVKPEKSNNFDAGIRYTSAMVQASFGAFLNKFSDRIVTSFDQNQGISVDRNVGRVEIKGLEASIDVRPFPWFTFRGFGSYIDAKLKDNIVAGVVGTTTIILPTAGKKLVETPEWQYGYRAQLNFNPISFGANFKHVSSRFGTDLNDQIVPSYNSMDVDARLSLKKWGLAKTYVQLNVINLFDQQHLGSISSQIALPTNSAGLIPGLARTAAIPGGANPTYAITAPRTVSLSVQFGF